MKTLFKTTALALATSSLLLAGCGGGSSDNDSGASQVASKGKVIDFYLDGANVLFAGCDKSTNTDGNGDFNIDDPACRGKNITVTGGTDIGTGLQNTVTLHALKVPRNDTGVVIVSPLTTLVYHTGTIYSTARMAKQLGLDANLLVVDPMTNAKLLKTTLVAQQLIIQTQAVLGEFGLGIADEAMASEAVAKALAQRLIENDNAGTPTTDLANTDFIQKVIETSVLNVKDSLSPALQTNINTAAKNVAAVSAGLIAEQVQKVDDLNITVVEGNPAATLAALKAGGQTAVVKEASQSEAAPNAVNAVADSLLTADPVQMKALGDALADGDRDAIEAAAGNLGLPQSAIDDLVNIEKYQDYIQLVDARFNGTQFDINTIRNSTSSNPLMVNGFKTIQLNMVQKGQQAVQQAKVGLSYTINGTNTLNIVVNDVKLEFSTAGKLLKATIPATTTYSVDTYGKATLSFAGQNLASDALTVDSNGVLNLSVDEFLNKAASKEPEFKAVINDYTPKAGNTLDIDVSLNLRVGIDANGTPANDTPVNAGNVNMVGKGVSAQLKIQ